MIKRAVSILLIAAILAVGFPFAVFSAEESPAEADFSVTVDLWNYVSCTGTVLTETEADGQTGNFLFMDEEGSITWEVPFENAGTYSVRMTYYTKGGKGSAIIRNLYVDDLTAPVGNGCVFDRAFVNEKDQLDTDKSGNQIRSVQVEKRMWQTAAFRDPNGYDVAPLSLELTAGVHTVRLESVREPVLIGKIEFYSPKKPISYAAYCKDTDGRQEGKNIAPVTIQGEDACLKSDSKLYQLSDQTSSATVPSDARKTVLNTIGADKWSSFGQWLCWEFEIKTAGYYKMSLRVKQDSVPGQPTYRNISFIDGPDFEELNSVCFPYGHGWSMQTVGDGTQDYRLYFQPGVYTLKMEVVLGEMSDIIRRVEDCMERLNEIYLSLLMLIGPTPDTYRDYQFKKFLPDEVKALGKESKVLQQIHDDYLQMCESGGSQAQTLENLAVLTEKMNQKPNKIASLFSEFSDSISGLGTWITTARKQGLEVDYITFSQYDDTLPKANASFFADAWFGFRQFIASFINDYQSATETGESLSVWLSSGRDQANTLIGMVNNGFVPQTGIKTEVQLVVAGTLMTATLAGRGPDVALTLEQSLPVNYAIRGAVKDLKQFKDFDTVAQRFQPSAMVPLSFDGAVYGLPETQSFFVMFYRKDILSRLNLSVPQTWDDVIAMLPILNQNNLNFGLPVPISTTLSGAGLKSYAMFYFQHGGAFYTKNGSRALLDSEAAATAFKTWTDFYTQYSLPYDYNFQNRFRSGEVPIGIADYGTYNVLSVFAPELNGLWDFALVPGVKTESGINHAVSGTVTACVIMNDAENPENAWEFLKWWTNADSQEFFGHEIESIMGTAARYQTANIEALDKIPWSAKDLKVLREQWDYTVGVPEVPGSYMTSRYIDFGFRQVLLNNTVETDPIQVLISQNKRINEEIKAKRKEFGLE